MTIKKSPQAKSEISPCRENAEAFSLPTGADKHNGEKERQKILAENKGCQILNMDGYPCGKKVVDINEMHLDHECHDYDKYPWVMVRVCKKHME